MKEGTLGVLIQGDIQEVQQEEGDKTAMVIETSLIIENLYIEIEIILEMIGTITDEIEITLEKIQELLTNEIWKRENENQEEGIDEEVDITLVLPQEGNLPQRERGNLLKRKKKKKRRK